MSGLHKVLNKIFLDSSQYSEYSENVLDSELLGLHKVVNKIFHHRYLAGF